MGDAVDIDTPRRDVGRHKDLDFVVSKLVEGSLTRVLRFVAVNGDGRGSASAQSFGHRIRAPFGAGENDCSGDLTAMNQLIQDCLFVAAVDEHQLLLNAFHAGDLGGHVNLYRFPQHAVGQLGDFRRHGSREKQRLAPSGQFTNDPLQIRQEAHVQHPIGFVQNEHFQAVEVNVALVHQVQEASGGGNQNMSTTIQAANLIGLPNSAIDQRMA